MNDTTQPLNEPPPVRRPFRSDTLFLQWVRLPLLVALALVAAKAIQRPFEGHGFESIVATSPGAPEVTANDGGKEAEPIEQPSHLISAPIDEPVVPNLVIATTPPLDPEAAAQSLGATVRFLRIAVRGSLQQLAQSGSQASYPLLQIKDWWLTPMDPPRNGAPGRSNTPRSEPLRDASNLGGTGSDRDPTSTPSNPGQAVTAGVQDPRGVSASTLIIANPASNEGAIRLIIDEALLTIEPGVARQFPAGERIVQFHRGGQFGNARYAIAQGVFVFDVTSDGWQLTHRDHLPSDVELVGDR